MKSVIVTTGATVPFIPLVSLFADADIQNKLISLGFTQLVIQYGHASEDVVQQLMSSTATNSVDGQAGSLQITGFSMVDNISKEIQNHDLVISHAGKDCFKCTHLLLKVTNVYSLAFYFVFL